MLPVGVNDWNIELTKHRVRGLCVFGWRLAHMVVSSNLWKGCYRKTFK